MEEVEIDLNKIRMEIFQRENPKEAEKLKQDIEQKVMELKIQINEMIEKRIGDYFEKKKLESPCPNYIG